MQLKKLAVTIPNLKPFQSGLISIGVEKIAYFGLICVRIFGSIPKINHYAEPLSYALSACHLVQTVLNARAMRISFEEARKL